MTLIGGIIIYSLLKRNMSCIVDKLTEGFGLENPIIHKNPNSLSDALNDCDEVFASYADKNDEGLCARLFVGDCYLYAFGSLKIADTPETPEEISAQRSRAVDYLKKAYDCYSSCLSDDKGYLGILRVWNVAKISDIDVSEVSESIESFVSSDISNFRKKVNGLLAKSLISLKDYSLVLRRINLLRSD